MITGRPSGSESGRGLARGAVVGGLVVSCLLGNFDFDFDFFFDFDFLVLGARTIHFSIRDNRYNSSNADETDDNPMQILHNQLA